MIAPKPAATPADADQFVRDFLSAVNGLCATADQPADTQASPVARAESRAPEMSTNSQEPVQESFDAAPSALHSSSGIFDEFVADRELRARFQVTSRELERLSQSSLLGSLTCKEDVVFMLRQIRAASDEASGYSERSFSEVASRIRSESLAKLAEASPLREILRHRDTGSFRLSRPALASMAVLVAACVPALASLLTRLI